MGDLLCTKCGAIMFFNEFDGEDDEYSAEPCDECLSIADEVDEAES